MNVDSLRYFVEVADCRSITVAARRLFISPQGLSKAMSSLEDEVMAKLVDRSPKGTALTREGQVFLEFARRTLEGYDRMQAELSAHRRAAMQAADAEIGATPHAVYTLLEDLPLADGFGQVRLAVMRPQAILDALDRPGEEGLYVIDLVEGSPLTARAVGDHCFTPVLGITLGVVRHADFPLDDARAARGDLDGVPLALFEDDVLDRIISGFFGDGHPDDVVLRTTNAGQIHKMLKSRRAAAILDSYAYYHMVGQDASLAPQLEFTPIGGMPGVTTGFIHRSDLAPESPALAVRDGLVTEVRIRNAAYLRVPRWQELSTFS